MPAELPQVTVGSPQRPGNVKATAGNGEVYLPWERPADNGATINGYSYLKKKAGAVGQTVVDISESALGEADADSVLISGLTGGAEYTFRVWAHNSRGAGQFPDTVTVTRVSYARPTAADD